MENYPTQTWQKREGCSFIKKKTYQTISLFTSAADRDRTGTGITTHGILSPGRLPVPPLRHMDGAYRARTYDPLLVRQMLSQLS